MIDKFFKSIQKPLVAVIILAILIFSIPIQSYAVLGVGDAVVVVGDTSPTGIKNAINHQMQWLKSFTLDRIATMITKQILHRMTAEVVNWINSGFEGSPAFLTNPEGFFLDVADQVTGAFLATNGPLSSLCSPFTIDIRLALALYQVALADQRYVCTLNRIIEAQSGGPTVTINGQTIVAPKKTISGFTGGDFSQGGWSAFMAMSTEPQNNPIGAFLTAKSDLNARVALRQNKISADLQIGQGFMSWEKCVDIQNGTNLDLNNEADIEKSRGLPSNPGVKQVQNPNGTFTYRQCETQTPGSVIAETLKTNLNVPVVELELADDINAVVNALVTQMVTKMLSEGLGALSGGSSGNGISQTQLIINDINSNTAAAGSIGNLQSSINPAVDHVNTYVTLYDESIRLLEDSRSRYFAAKACLVDTLTGDPFLNASERQAFQMKISQIDNMVSNSLVHKLNALMDKKGNALTDRQELQDLSDSLSGTGSTAAIQDAAQKYSEMVQSGRLYDQNKIDEAQLALTNTQSQVQIFNREAAELYQYCSSNR